MQSSPLSPQGRAEGGKRRCQGGRHAVTQYDRTVEDLGNVVSLEHVNTRVPDQQLATLFYASGLGLTRDPYLMTGVTNMWINVGRSQFHLPTARRRCCAVIRELVMPGPRGPGAPAGMMSQPPRRHALSFKEHEEFVEATCPWGNRIRCYASGARFGRMMLGMPCVELNAPLAWPMASCASIRESSKRPALAVEDEQGQCAHVLGRRRARSSCSARRTCPRRPSTGTMSPSTWPTSRDPTAGSSREGLFTEESDQHQYRFQDIVDPDSGGCCSRSSTRCAACATRSMRGRWSTAIRPTATALRAGTRGPELVAADRRLKEARGHGYLRKTSQSSSSTMGCAEP